MAKRGRPTNKDMVSAFGERYQAFEHNGGYLLYDKERKSDYSKYLYLGKFYITTDGESYVFNEDRYKTTDELINAIEEYNKTLPFSSEVYNPIFRKHIRIEYAVQEYLYSLGFKMEWGKCDPAYGSVYSVKDMYGSPILEIMVHVDEDTTEGTIVRNISQSKWTESAFTDLDSAIGSVNSILSAYVAVVNSQTSDILSKMTTARASNVYDKTFDIKSLSTYATDAKAKTIEYLENELKRLKG